jgi:hypothetical protein
VARKAIEMAKMRGDSRQQELENRLRHYLSEEHGPLPRYGDSSPPPGNDG